MSNTKTLAANMRNAFVERRHATIGGGQFTPEELRDGAIALSAYDDVLAALQAIAVLSRPHQEVTRSDAVDIICDIWNAAKAAIAKATGETK